MYIETYIQYTANLFSALYTMAVVLYMHDAFIFYICVSVYLSTHNA